MLGLYVSVPIASFRKGAAREYWETHPLPPPSTIYGFLLSAVGEQDRDRHIGVCCTAGLIGQPGRSKVLRKLWRVKDKKLGQGNGVNVRPDYQELLTGVELAIWLDSSGETGPSPHLERRVAGLFDGEHRKQISRFGGLSLGESTNLVDSVIMLDVWRARNPDRSSVELFLATPEGNATMPVWVDHVGSRGTRSVIGDFVASNFDRPDIELLSRIHPD